MPTLTLSLSPERIEQLRAAFTAQQDNPLTLTNLMVVGALTGLPDPMVAQLAGADIPLLSLACLLECTARGVRVKLD